MENRIGKIYIAAFSYNDAKYIRREMQVNNQDLYYLYMYLTVFALSEKELEYLLNKVEGILRLLWNNNKKSKF